MAEIARDRDQLWAEAVLLYKGGQRWWFDRDKDALLMQQITADTRLHDVATDDPWMDRLRDYAEGEITLEIDEVEPLGAKVIPGHGVPRSAIAAKDVCVVLNMDQLRADQRSLWRVKAILSTLGFSHDRSKVVNASAFAPRTWGWKRVEG